MVALWWCGALLASRWGAVPLVVFVAGAVAVQLAPPRWAVPAGRLAAAAVVALVLIAAADLYGAALAAGIVIAAVTGIA